MTTFQEQLAADLAVFFNSNEFGRAATYTPVSGSAITTTVLIEEGAGMQDNVMGINPAAVARISVQLAVITNPKQHDTFTVGTKVWTVVDEISRDINTAILLVASKERLGC